MTRCDYCKKFMWPWQGQWRGPYWGYPWTHQTCHEERERDFISKFGSEELTATYARLAERASRDPL